MERITTTHSKVCNAITIQIISLIATFITILLVATPTISSEPSPLLDSEKIMININTATREELVELDGIGYKKADSIIKYRQIKGKYESIDELIKVKGIGRSIIKKNRSLLTTE